MIAAASSAIVGALARLFPLRAQPVAALLERAAAALQGKGVGSKSVDAEVLAAFAHAPRQKLTVFDVGANAGDWTRAALRHASDRIERLVAFEPAAVHRASLASITRDDSRLLHVSLAVTDGEGERLLYSPADGSELASLTQRRLDHLGVNANVTESVRTTTLDDYTQQHAIERIHLLKMDIEGYELSALRGASRLLENRAIDVVAFEFGGCNIDTRTFFQDFWYLLVRQYGFRVGRILLDGRIAPIQRYTEALEMFSTTNYVAWAPRASL